MGTLAHVCMWVTMTGLGLLVLRSRGTWVDVDLDGGSDPPDSGTQPHR